MKLTSTRKTLSFFLATAVIASLAGCDQIRKVTYPQDFTYLDEKEVDALMQKMSESMGRLDRLVAEASPEDTVQQAAIITELNKLENTATRLSGGHTQTNQFVISEHIEGFISDIGTAKMFANMDPPKYYKVEYVTHACAQCHQLR